MARKLISFDWAMKKLLRNKANFGILEGFLSELLGFDVFIDSILESESNKNNREDKSNKVDILVNSQNGELMLVELQYESEVDYFHRMLYGVSKLLSEYIKESDNYDKIKKVYSINIVYFGLGQGMDYIYEYKGNFVGLHYQDILKLTDNQAEKYKIASIADIFPTYYILRVNNFDDIAKDSLDEWIYFLKNGEIKDSFQAKGLQEANEKLAYEKLSEEEKAIYKRKIEDSRVERGVIETARFDGERIGIAKGIAEGERIGIAKGKELAYQEAEIKLKNSIKKALLNVKLSIEEIAEMFEVSTDFVLKVKNEVS